jgi:hypothetical protein
MSRADHTTSARLLDLCAETAGVPDTDRPGMVNAALDAGAPDPLPSQWEEAQRRDALASVLFYGRRALTLGASEDDVYDQVVAAVTQMEAQRDR